MTAAQKDRALSQRIFGPMVANVDDCDKAANTLRRAQMTLHRWAELECGTTQGHIERLEQLDGKTRPVFVPDWRGRGPGGVSPHVIPDREAGAIRRVEQVCKNAGLFYFHQTDPRGCALYVAAEPLTDQNYSSKGIPCL